MTATRAPSTDAATAAEAPTRLAAQMEREAARRWPGREDARAVDDPDWRYEVDHLVGPPVPLGQASPTPPPAATPGRLLVRLVREGMGLAVDWQNRQRAERLTGPVDADRRRRRVLAMRRQFDGFAGRRTPSERVTITSAPIAGVPCDTVTADGADTSRVVLWIHGGAYVVCSPRTHHGIATGASRAVRARVVLPDYGLAPERPFPNGLQDVLAVYRRLLDLGTDPRQVLVAGDSAGGGLGLALLLACRASGTPMPAAYLGLSPWTDLTFTGESNELRDAADPWISTRDADAVAQAYAPDVQPSHPLVSPLFADLAGLPPMLVQVGTHEVIHDDSTRLVERAREAGVDATLSVWDGMWHVFQAFPRLRETRAAWQEVRRFARAHLR